MPNSMPERAIDSAPLRRLPDSELEVMQAVWACQSAASGNAQPVTRGAIERSMNRTPPPAATTLLTLLGRLAEKDFLKIEKNGRSSVYLPLVSREEYLSAQSNRFVQKLCGGSISAFASALCSSGLSRAELEELRELLREGTL